MPGSGVFSCRSLHLTISTHSSPSKRVIVCADPEVRSKDAGVLREGSSQGRVCWGPKWHREEDAQGCAWRGCAGARVQRPRAWPPHPGRCQPPAAGPAIMRSKQVNLLISFVAVTLFSFSCFCISKLTQTCKQRAVSSATPTPGFQDPGMREWPGRGMG